MRVFPIILIPEKIENILQEIELELQKIGHIPSQKPIVSKRHTSSSRLRQLWVDVIFIFLTIVSFSLALATKNLFLFIIYLALITAIRIISTNYKLVEQVVLLLNKKTVSGSTNKAAVLEKIRYLRAKISRIFAQSFAGERSKNNAQVGYSEEYFQRYLEKYFPGCIFDQVEFPIDGNDFPYSADFIYHDSDGIKIDLEVDEPYSYKNPQPIHFLMNRKDSKRNKYFLEQGWIVIRFAEEQVVRYPQECCKALAQTISKINGQPYFQKFKGVGNLKKIEIWTETEAIKMINQKYRNSYTHILRNSYNQDVKNDVDSPKF